jgi:hypothetical protein
LVVAVVAAIIPPVVSVVAAVIALVVAIVAAVAVIALVTAVEAVFAEPLFVAILGLAAVVIAVGGWRDIYRARLGVVRLRDVVGAYGNSKAEVDVDLGVRLCGSREEECSSGGGEQCFGKNVFHNSLPASIRLNTGRAGLVSRNFSAGLGCGRGLRERNKLAGSGKASRRKRWRF